MIPAFLSGALASAAWSASLRAVAGSVMFVPAITYWLSHAFRKPHERTPAHAERERRKARAYARRILRGRASRGLPTAKRIARAILRESRASGTRSAWLDALVARTYPGGSGGGGRGSGGRIIDLLPKREREIIRTRTSAPNVLAALDQADARETTSTRPSRIDKALARLREEYAGEGKEGGAG